MNVKLGRRCLFDSKNREEIFTKVRVSSTRIYATWRQRSDYVYDYQLIRKGGGIIVDVSYRAIRKK